MTRRRTNAWATVVASLAWLTLPLPTFGIWPFPPKRFSGNAMMDAGSRGIDTDGRVVAYGDFNGDQFLDALVLSATQQTLTVFLWDHENYEFVNGGSFQHPQKIYNVIPGDFTQDGRLDLLVVSQGKSNKELGVQLYVGLPEGGFDLDYLSAPVSAPAEPIPVDTNGDLKIDLFGVTPTSTSTFKVWQNVWNASQTRGPVFNVVDPKMDGAQCKISNPHSNAAVDLNGDCLADMFLVCDEDNGVDKYFQIWINNKDEGFSLAQLGRFPQGMQTVTFGDIDRDGTMDMLFVTCDSVSHSNSVGVGCKVNIAYNKQLPLCSSTAAEPIKNGKRVCRLPTDLCTADPDFRFDLREGSDNPDFVRIPISDIFPHSEGDAPLHLLVHDKTYDPIIPLPVRLGDANQDGFPDLLAIVSSGHVRTPQLAYSVPCGKGIAGCDSNGRGRRGFQALSKGGEALASITDAKSVAFIDMDDDGTLDIMVQRTGSQGHGKVTFIQNNFYYDAFFLKAIVLNGACGSGLCVAPNKSTKYHPFGVSYSGATYKYSLLDTSGRRAAAEIAQLPQTAYHALLTPYAYFGLGRTNNYIENLFVGSTKHTEEHYINMEGVIPNSKLVIIPPLGNDETNWRKELYLRPGEWIPWVTLTVVSATILLAIIVFVLHLSEKREDELERRRVSHHINFDAL
ncbi:hypothetical protein EIP91_002634 [Steccherinum ochraceum]|uniref:T-cell immunomodulatory protein TIP C2 domain-containing protein n=1 Tax=Steccherinum ochraceum TaxID=92696 RepID=A0A4R0S2H8_9APHY|nr:hypothetical protein EIP91_002634 [Steccherinum ochraceum]